MAKLPGSMVRPHAHLLSSLSSSEDTRLRCMATKSLSQAISARNSIRSWVVISRASSGSSVLVALVHS
jgi:hypothetical protein